MRITHLEAIPYSLPYKRAARFASGTVERADDVLVRVHTDDGLIGQEEAQPRPYTYGETQTSIVATIRDWFSPALAGVNPLASEQVADRIAGLAGSNVARGAVELARLREKPIAKLAEDLGISDSCLRNWMTQADINDGRREGLTSDERAELVKLRREKRVLEMEVEILKRASAYFARENVLPK